MKDIFIGRQPIYDTSMQVFAYEILFRDGQKGGANVVDGEKATSQVLLNAFLEIGFDNITNNHPGFFNFTRDFLLNEELDFPKELVVFEVLENIEIDAAVIAAVRKWKQRGYRIALDDFAFEAKWQPLLELADIIKVEVPALSKRDAMQKVRDLAPFKAKLLAEKVETHEEYEFYKRLGFHYFQGYFFCKPNIISSKTVSTSKLSMLQLLARLQNPDVKMTDMEAIIRKDLSLSYKLLKYLNSPFFGLTSKITSITQALSYLGLNTVRMWVTIIAMSGVDDKPSELTVTVLQRARKCERLAEAMKIKDMGSHFLAGLFSLLDAMMDTPMASLLVKMPLSDDVVDGILHRKGDIGRVLTAVERAEKGEWDPLIQLGLPSEKNHEILLEAISWADHQMEALASAAK